MAPTKGSTMNSLQDPPSESKPQAKPKKKTHTQKDIENFIKGNLPQLDRPIIKTSLSNVTPSYWRVNVWGKKINSTCSFGDNEILLSKFVRIDLDNDGKMIYNDVTDGKEL